MPAGVCVGWVEEKGFGFIRPDAGGADIFVHRSELATSETLVQGWRVTFELGMDERRGKPKAVRVRVI